MLVNHKDHAYKEIWQLGYGHDSNVYANEILVHGLGKLSSILLFLYMDINSPVKKKSVEHEGMKWDMMLISSEGWKWAILQMISIRFLYVLRKWADIIYWKYIL